MYELGQNENYKVYASKTVAKNLPGPYSRCKEMTDVAYR
jgi:hypothetical protein